MTRSSIFLAFTKYFVPLTSRIGHVASPSGSTQLTGLCTYPYGFNPPSSPIGPGIDIAPSRHHSSGTGCNATRILHPRTDPQNAGYS